MINKERRGEERAKSDSLKLSSFSSCGEKRNPLRFELKNERRGEVKKL